MSPIRVLRGFFLGAIGGLTGWALVELLFRLHQYDNISPPPTTSPSQQGLVGGVLGLAIGGFLGVSEGIAEGTAGRFRRAVGTFLAMGFVGGFVGLYFGQHLFATMGGRVDVSALGLRDFFPQLVIRGLAWMLIGAFIGLALGVPNLSPRRMWNGGVGGALGGFLAGAIFQLLAYTGIFHGIQGRLVGFVILGAIVGFFVNLVAEALKQVWVKVLIGRNEGREHAIDTPVATIGRDELADVPVFLDPHVPKRIASLRLNGGRYGLHAESDALPILVNGQPLLPGQVLKDGDAIQFGRVTLGYFEKATATSGRRPVDTVSLAEPGTRASVPGAMPIPKGAGVCPFCGQRQDPATGACACSVPAGPGTPGPLLAPDPYATAAYGAGTPGMPGGTAAATVLDMGYAAPQPAAPDECPRLLGVDGPYSGQSIPLLAADMEIGREAACAIPLTLDPTTSRRHARIYYNGTHWVLRDEGSSNGTFVNEARIQEQVLSPGDVLRVGASRFRLDA